MDELERRTEQHFTAAELVEFLGITVNQIFAEFDELIADKYRDLADEVCFEFEEEEEDD